MSNNAISVHFCLYLLQIFVLLQVDVCIGGQQRLTLVSSVVDWLPGNSTPVCSGQWLYPITDSTSFFKFENLTGINVYGMWRIGVCDEETNNCFTVSTLTDNLDGECILPKYLLNRTTFEFIRYGNEYQNEAMIYLYRSNTTSFWGEPIVIERYGADFPGLITVHSFFSTGNHKWSLFSEKGFQGTRFCLEPTPEVIRKGYGFTTQTGRLVVGSVKYGCEEDQTSTTEVSTVETTISSTPDSSGVSASSLTNISAIRLLSAFLLTFCNV